MASPAAILPQTSSLAESMGVSDLHKSKYSYLAEILTDLQTVEKKTKNKQTNNNLKNKKKISLKK